MRQSLQKPGLLTYAAPIILALIFVLIFAKLLFGGNDAPSSSDESPTPSSNTSAVERSIIVTPSGEGNTVNHKKKGVGIEAISDTTNVIQDESVEVLADGANIRLPAPSTTRIALDENSRVRYLGYSNGRDTIGIENKHAWVQTGQSDLIINAGTFDVFPAANSVININKNDIFTTVSVVKGSAQITEGEETLEVEQGFEVKVQSLKSLADSIPSPYGASFTSSTWFEKNGGNTIEEEQAVSSGALNTSESKKSHIQFTFPTDNSSVDTKTVSLSGNILSILVDRVEMSGIEAKIDSEKGTFILENIPLSSTKNDLVYRAYGSGTELEKGVFTLSTTQPQSGSNTGSAGNVSAESVIDALTSDERYAITSPASDYYTSTNYFEKITGKVTDNRVSAVSVNDYRLKSYKPATGEWEYNANANHGNFDYGKNLFWVKYYDANDNEVHKQLFVIDRVRPGTATE